MRLGELSSGIGRLVDPSAGDVEISHITHDSRKVQFGSLFVAIEGTNSDGHSYIGCATQMGAACVLTKSPKKVPCSMPILVVDDPRRAMALLARRLYRRPDQNLKVIGITGTNGKTTITFLLQGLLQPLGKCGRIGTLSYFNGITEERAGRTTPESPDMFRSLGEMVSNGCRYAAVEISSHGLMYERVLGLELHYALFTNLSRDHLDFHGDMESYFKAKQRQFSHLREGGLAIVNWDDAYGRRVEIPPHAKMVRVGESPDADLRFKIVNLGTKGCDFVLYHGKEQADCHIPLLGKHNIYNFACSAAVALSEGMNLQQISSIGNRATAVPGRTELLEMGQDFGVVIDFAHTPDALRNVLQACRSVGPNRLITVFGAGGDRDQTKRPEMGTVVDSLSDIVILTSDNPRSEDPEAIMDMIQSGIKRGIGQHFYRDWERRQAIKTALNLAQKGDLVLIAGKGHETTQEIKGRFQPFDDRDVASRIIKKMLEHV